MEFGDFKQLERDMNLDGVTVPDSSSWFDNFSFEDATKTAGSWIDSLGKTFLKVKTLENAVKSKTASEEKEQLQRSYEQTMQGEPSSSSSSGFQLQQKHLIYAGIGLAALMVLKR